MDTTEQLLRQAFSDRASEIQPLDVDRFRVSKQDSRPTFLKSILAPALGAVAITAAVILGQSLTADTTPVNQAASSEGGGIVGTWTLVPASQGQTGVLELKENNRFLLDDGCNTYAGTYKRESKSFTFVDVDQSLMLCTGVDSYANRLVAQTRSLFASESITFMDVDGKVLAEFKQS